MINDEWLTPPDLLAKLGPFDLDPCAPAIRPWDMAAKHYTAQDMGLMRPWHGRVWLNPPYGSQTRSWLQKLAAHGDGIALVFARTETEMFFSQVWNRAHGLMFIENRLHFHLVDGTRAKNGGGAPSVLVAYGRDNAKRLKGSGIKGAYVDSWLVI
jgi:hypothetical protein